MDDTKDISNENILPSAPHFKNADGFAWDKNNTPTFISIIPSLGSYIRGFPELTIYAEDGKTVVLECKSIRSVVGWEYETEPGNWTAFTPAGIPKSVVNGINRLRYTVQKEDALTANMKYIIKGRVGGSKK
ncbi:MAG: hypothetical protein WCU00_03115 [Candidatus Latescibacterota bacterium]